VVNSVDQVLRPIDRFVPTLEDDQKLAKAEKIVIKKCMKTFNFSYTGGDGGDSTLNGLSDIARGYKRSTPLYGYFGTDMPSSLGYNRIAELSPDPPHDSEYLTALGGTDSTGKPVNSLRGLDVPPGGCSKRGSDAIGGALPRPDDRSLPDGGPRIPEKDSRIAKADSAWSACMKNAGFNYRDPVNAFLDTRWSRSPDPSKIIHTSDEVATESADLRCKKSTNLIGIAIAVQAAYDQKYIATHTRALTDFQSQLTSRLHDADVVISSELNG